MYTLPALHTTKVVAEPGSAVDADALTAFTGPARNNRGNVIEGAQSVERLLAEIITRHFFPEGGRKADDFRSWIVETETCSFQAKRQLVVWLIKEQALLTGKALSEHDKLLGDAMRYRNAFAHGGLSSDGQRVWLSYFQGKPEKVELTDEYLRKVESTLSRAYHETRQLFEAPDASP